MNRDQAKQYILDHATELLTPDSSHKGYICPVCGSGNGPKGTGITTKDGGKHFTCWAGCFTSSDIFDIIGKAEHIPDFPGQLDKAAQMMGITIDQVQRSSPADDFSRREEKKKDPPAQIKQGNNEEVDQTAFYLEANKHIQETSYHRGLSLETLNHFKVGFVSNWIHPKRPRDTPSERLIIPISKYSYLARYAKPGDFIGDGGAKINKAKVKTAEHPSWIFNSKALKTAQRPIFCVEGEIDAMSIVDVGGEAVGLGSISHVREFLECVEALKPTQPLIIALDNEDTVQVRNALGRLTAGLTELGVEYSMFTAAGGSKDANEALMQNRDKFKATVASAEAAALQQIEDKKAAALEEVKREAAAYSLQSFLQDIENSKTAPYYPTKFEDLDKLIDGGLYAGLYFIGAISSLGKTTFALQIADSIAASGADVLIFSLEMARNELIAKSVSRLTFLQDLAENETTVHAKTTRGILTGSRYAAYNQKERETIQKAIEAYSQYAKNIYITEGIGNVGVSEVRAKVEKHVRITGKAPVVLIDYLQILAPADIRATDKQNTDKAVLELKRLSRDYGIPIIGISSFNRDNYNAPVNNASFKESGAIEYSSDVLIGLQYWGMDYQEGETDKAREKRIRALNKENIRRAKNGEAQRIQLKILKNRNGSKGDMLLDFYPMFNYFKPVTEFEEEKNLVEDGWTLVSQS